MGHVVDLFALGVILFIMYAGHPPFNQAVPRDPHYKLLVKFRPDMFWKSHEQGKAPGFFTEEFKDLITNMLAHNPSSRLSMADIIGHPWMQSEETATHQQVLAEFEMRHNAILKQKADEAAAAAQAKKNQKQRVHRALFGNVFYEDDEEVSNEMRENGNVTFIKMPMKNYVEGVQKNTIIESNDSGL